MTRKPKNYPSPLGSSIRWHDKQAVIAAAATSITSDVKRLSLSLNLHFEHSVLPLEHVRVALVHRLPLDHEQRLTFRKRSRFRMDEKAAAPTALANVEP